jgi:hypothetical protein
MSGSSNAFKWNLFIKRVWAGPVVGLVWMINRLVDRNWVGALIAFSVGFVLCPAIAYVWTQRSSRGA